MLRSSSHARAGATALRARRRRPRARPSDRRPAGIGLDAVLLCASSSSPDPLELAVRLARDRGRIVVVGETRIDVDRAPMYEKELELRMSRSYGPGRYDRDYEERGRDLAAGYVRWTEQRNMQAFLELVAAGQRQAGRAHDAPIPDRRGASGLRAAHPTGGGARPFGVLLKYAEADRCDAAAHPQRRDGRTRDAGLR